MSSVRSPFEALAQLPPLQALGPTRSPASRHAVFHGLIGAARSLAAGAAGLSRGGAVLLLVDGAEAALDAIADLRAIVGVDEAVRGAAKPKGKKLTEDDKKLQKLVANEEPWIDPGRSSHASMPEDLKKGLRLETALFPAWDVLPTESDRPEGITLAGRGRVTERLRDIRNRTNAPPHCYVVVAPITAVMQPTESPGDAAKNIVLRAGDEHDPILLGRRLGAAGYERVGQAEVRGEYALRGGILDIFPYTADTPYRIDFFGETIESIKPFDPISQRSEDPVDEISFADASTEGLRKLFSPGASAGPYSILDHLPQDALIVYQQPQVLRQRAELYQASLTSGKSVFFELDEFLAKSRAKFDTLQLINDWETARESDDDSGAGSREPGAGTATFPQLDPVDEHTLNCTSLQRVHGDIEANAEAWKKLVADRSVLVFCETPGHRHRLTQLLEKAGAAPSRSLKLVLGKLSGGFDLRDAGIAALSDNEILGISRHASAAPKAKSKQTKHAVAILHLVDLQVGDYVVHQLHGIARYLGLSRLEKSGRMEDYLTLLFANDVKLYVPAAHIGWIGKYIGGHAATELSTIGSKAWARKKDRAAKAIRDIAEDLLGVQAARRSLPGIVYPPDTDWQDDFEKAFPYDETPDQDTAIVAVKKDMEGTCPMDRLICGDVGFGKTEIALRAAFKAVSSSKQVAVLVPTTLLAEQHGRSFKERFAGFPFTVETLSRFKTPSEQRKLLEKLANGRVDIVVGTHRLLQKDVRFKDLGLAVIDEEQRFGVEHKEFFKKLRKTVDVLTLTATPIPRTMHMALIGLRDISNLTTPPRNRRPVTTKVARVSEDLLRRALLREISRGGQVFVVHPRVKDIVAFKNRLAELVPEATFAVGHGQMDPDDLEEVMGSFLNHRVDVLVSTTIVESGLDIPSANTIIIHEADHFGLAELHQLRGRVGRSDIQAYCYLLLPESRVLTPEGLRRLRALEEFDELGAGFQLALKDLEIRGTGNVLGSEQSGQIAEIGYELYCKLLDATVKGLRGEQVEEEMEVSLQLRGASFIPEEYVQDDKVVLEFYRRLDAIKDDRETESLKAEVLDRFGPLPPPVERMFEESKLRRMARAASVPYIGIDNDEGRLVIKLHGWDLKAADKALRGLPELKGVRVLDGQTLTFGMTLRAKHDESLLRDFVKRLLELLIWGKKQGYVPSLVGKR